MYSPKIAQMATHATLLIPRVDNILGVVTKTYEKAAAPDLFIEFKSRGGTEMLVDGVLLILDTADVTTYFRPDITKESMIRLDDGKEYEIIGEPEDIELRHRYMKFKVKRYTGGA